MTYPDLDKLLPSLGVILLGMLLKFLYRLVRPWIRTREERDKAAPKSKPEAATFFTAFVFVCGVAFVVLALLAVALPESSPERPIVSALATGAGALTLIGLLSLIFGVPAYKRVMELDDRVSQSLEHQNQDLDHFKQLLEYQYWSLEVRYLRLEDRHLKLEERMRGLELENPGQNAQLEGQSSLQRNFPFMEIRSVPKRDTDVKRLTGSSQR